MHKEVDYTTPAIDYKFNEKALIEELKEHIDKTYDDYYAESKIQATEFILDSGLGEGFCIGNIMKYAQRYGKKGNSEDHRRDLAKILHYAMIAIYNHDLKHLNPR